MTFKGLPDVTDAKVGQHFGCKIGSLQIYAQVLITSWVVLKLLCSVIITTQSTNHPMHPSTQFSRETKLRYVDM